MFRIKRSNLLQSKEFWNEMTLPPLNNVSHLFRGGRVIQYGADDGTRTRTAMGHEPLRICQLEFSTPHQKKQKDRKKELTSGGTDGNIIFALQRALKMREWWNWQTR